MNQPDSLIAGYSLTKPREQWETIVAAFRSLGGVADNIRLGPGRSGRGLFPIDPAQPFRLHIPENLMFPVEDINFEGDRLTVSEISGLQDAEREFFERYANALTWGGGARQDLLARVAAFDALPNNVRTLLVDEFGMAPWLEGEPATRAQEQFLLGRVYDVGGREVLLPVMELAGHDSQGATWSAEGGVEVAGQANGEIFVSYGLHDPFSMFHRFAFASREPIAFSLPASVQMGATTLSIGRSFEIVRRGDAILPQLTNTGDGLTLSFLMLGHQTLPRLPRGTFRALMNPLGIGNVDEEFDRILHANWSKFLRLLRALESHRGELVVSLRNMALYQIEAMSFCIGARNI